MTILVYGSAIGLSWYAFRLARAEWKSGNKKAGLGIALLSGCYLPLAIYLSIRV